MSEKHYILPPISKTPTRDNPNNNITILTTNRRRSQSKIPIFYSTAAAKTVQEYIALNKSSNSAHHMNSFNDSTVYVEEAPLPSPQYTDKWKFQYVRLFTIIIIIIIAIE